MPLSPLRIAVYHDLPSGGAKRTVHAQVAELVRRGHRVECFVTSEADERFLPLQEVAHRVTVVEVPEPPDREKALAGTPSPVDLVRWGAVFRGVRGAARAVADAVDAGQYDVLLVHPSQFTQAPHVLRWSRTPTVYYCHEVLRAAYDPLISPWPVRMLIRWTLGRVDRRNARAATLIAVNSRYTGQRAEAVYGRRGTVVAPAVDVQRFRPADGRDDYVLAVGALHPLKGIDLIVEAVGRLPSGIRPRLVVVADRAREREARRIEERAAALDVTLDVRHRVPEPELAGLYARARAVLVAPHREPLGLVPLEAMASGTPVVAVAEGGVTETVVDGETAYLVPRDPDRFAERVRWLLEHPEEADAMGQKGRRHAERYWTWERSVDALVELLREAAGRR